MGVGITTIDSCVKQALRKKTLDVFWFALGRTTAWANEAQPPDESAGAHAIDEPICYVLADVVSLCTPVESGGDVQVDGQEYAFVADVDAYTEGARFLYIHADFNVEESPGLPYAGFRQHGLYSGLTPAAGHEADVWLAPVNVQDPGQLEYYRNHPVASFGPGDPREVKLILESR